ncbi:hypothetical protein ACIPJ2_02340 [Curtobacterium sp. NPDC090217]|uniref:NucA/NucB deoxyribonuclease domain-containing protein n=1 Tax=Curtobacterium sp. NPDC090217 TaxID=3363970 RepID=UPI003822A080
MVPGTSMQGSSHFTWRGTAGARVQPRPLWEFTFSHPNGITIDGAIYKSPKIRCDRDYPGRPSSVGCVFPQQHADEWVSGDRASWWGSHVANAQSSGLPVSLHRATTAEVVANRAAACTTAPRPRPTVPGSTEKRECDEYPFASAAEGAASGTGTVRVLNIYTWDGSAYCNMPPTVNQTGEGGWSICLIPASDNRTGGQILNSLYKAFRVIPGDEYSIRIYTNT